MGEFAPRDVPLPVAADRGHGFAGVLERNISEAPTLRLSPSSRDGKAPRICSESQAGLPNVQGARSIGAATTQKEKFVTTPRTTE